MANLRMALILLDNVAEVIMAKKIEAELTLNHVYREFVEFADKHPEHVTDREMTEKARKKYLPKKHRQNVDKNFGSKVELLVAREYLEPALGFQPDQAPRIPQRGVSPGQASRGQSSPGRTHLL